MHCESVCVLGDAAGVLMSKQKSRSLSRRLWARGVSRLAGGGTEWRGA